MPQRKKSYTGKKCFLWKSMKKLIKKFFDAASAPQTAFFTVLLATLGTWSIAAWMTLGGWLINFSKAWKLSPCFLVIFAVFALAASFCNLAFFYTRVPEKFKKWFIPACILLSLAVWGSGYFFGREIGYYTFIAAFFWLLPRAVFHKDSHWVIPGSACWTFVFLGGPAFYEVIVCCYRVINFIHAETFSITFNIAIIGFFTLWGALFCLFKLYSGNENWKKMFSRPNLTVLVAFIISWSVMIGAAFNEERTYQKNLVQAGKFFGFPLTAEGVRDFYYKEGSDNIGFWKNLEQHFKPFEDLTAARKQDDFIVFPKGKLDKKNFDTWKNTFDESPQLKKISDLFSSILPPKMREYKKYYLSGIILDELLLLRKLARVQVWRIRFALQNNDIATVIDALDCINKSIDRLDKDHITISHLFSYALLLEKKSAFELLLENGKLEQHELKKQLDILTEKRKQLAAMERAALGGEITLLFDFQDQIWEGKSWLPAIKNFRWFVPQYWYVIRHSCNLFIKSKQKNSYKGDPLLTQHILFDRTMARKNIPKRYTELDTMYLLLETLLKLELEKRKQGFYPATAPEWLPVDPFSGKKFHYIKGKIPVFERIYNPQTRFFDRVRCEAEAVAVWSEGCNGKNDDGIGKHEKHGHDDIRAMIRL